MIILYIQLRHSTTAQTEHKQQLRTAWSVLNSIFNSCCMMHSDWTDKNCCTHSKQGNNII